MEPISRKDAKAKGLTRYFTGTPCIRGHVALRRTVNHACVECDSEKAAERYRSLPRDHPHVLKTRERARQWALANPERYKKRMKQWAETHSDKKLAYAKNYLPIANAKRRARASQDPDYYRRQYAKRKSSPEFKAAAIKRTKEWRKKNPEEAKKLWAEWRLRNPDAVRASRKARALMRRAGGKVSASTVREIRARRVCAACGDIHALMEIDHIKPVSRGGTNHPSNLQLLCKPCNQSKWTYDYEEWLANRAD